MNGATQVSSILTSPDGAMSFLTVRIGQRLLKIQEGPQQHRWLVSEISEGLYPAQSTKKRAERIADVWGEVLKAHQMLWPGEQVPARSLWEQELHGRSQSCVPTSVFFALVVWGVLAPKRSEDSRKQAEEFLADIIKRAATHGFGVSFQKFEENGHCIKFDAWVDSGLTIDCWTQSMSDAMAIPWDSAVLDGNAVYPKTPRDQTSVIDFVIWALRPVAMRSRVADKFHERKHLLRMTALSIVTHVAVAFEQGVIPGLKLGMHQRVDRAMESGDEEVNLVRQGRKRKRLRISANTANIISERAAALLFTGKDSWIKWFLDFFGIHEIHGRHWVHRVYQALITCR